MCPVLTLQRKFSVEAFNNALSALERENASGGDDTDGIIMLREAQVFSHFATMMGQQQHEPSMFASIGFLVAQVATLRALTFHEVTEDVVELMCSFIDEVLSQKVAEAVLGIAFVAIDRLRQVEYAHYGVTTHEVVEREGRIYTLGNYITGTFARKGIGAVAARALAMHASTGSIALFNTISSCLEMIFEDEASEAMSQFCEAGGCKHLCDMFRRFVHDRTSVVTGLLMLYNIFFAYPAAKEELVKQGIHEIVASALRLHYDDTTTSGFLWAIALLAWRSKNNARLLVEIGVRTFLEDRTDGQVSSGTINMTFYATQVLSPAMVVHIIDHHLNNYEETAEDAPIYDDSNLRSFVTARLLERRQRMRKRIRRARKRANARARRTGVTLTLEQRAATEAPDGDKKEAEQASLECAICLMEINEVLDSEDEVEVNGGITRVACGHVFHRLCLNMWMGRCASHGTASTCPMCRGRL